MLGLTNNYLPDKSLTIQLLSYTEYTNKQCFVAVKNALNCIRLTLFFSQAAMENGKKFRTSGLLSRQNKDSADDFSIDDKFTFDVFTVLNASMPKEDVPRRQENDDLPREDNGEVNNDDILDEG